MKTWVKTGATVGALCTAMALAACGPDDSKKTIAAVGPVTAKTSEIECKSAMELSAYDAVSGGNSGKTKSGTETKPEKKPTTKAPEPSSTPTTKPKDGKSGKAGKVKNCTTDYELVISAKEGVVEEDVTAEVWNLCTEGENYPECATEVNP